MYIGMLTGYCYILCYDLIFKAMQLIYVYTYDSDLKWYFA